MNEKEAINLLINVAELGQSKGIFDLKSAKLVSEAVDLLRPNPETLKIETPEQVDAVRDTEESK